MGYLIGEILDQVSRASGSIALVGDKIKLRLPENYPDAPEIVDTIRRNRKVVIAMLRDIESKPPSLDEVKAMLPFGVRLVSYRPREAPFAVAPVSVVTNAGKFYWAYLADLSRRLAKPQGYYCPPLADILSKLADAGLELQIESREGTA